MKTTTIILLISLIIFSSFSLCSCNFAQPVPSFKLTAEDIYQQASPSVVEIQGTTLTGTSTGTGFFYDDKGTLVTNYHVIAGCTDATISLNNGETYKVEHVLGYSAEKDIAILATSYNNSKALAFRSDNINTGETIYTIGSSLGLTGSLSNGIISSSERIINGNTYIQITAPISKGNSGGPLLDETGKVIGITSAFLINGQNLNLAIPIKEVEQLTLDKPTSLSSLLIEYIENNPEEALGVTLEQYKIAKIIAADSTNYCLNISEVKSFISKYSNNNDLQIDNATEYINSLSWDYGQKIIMYKLLFLSDNSYNNDIIDYLNERDDISYSEMEYILINMDFEVDDDGYVYWD